VPHSFDICGTEQEYKLMAYNEPANSTQLLDHPFNNMSGFGGYIQSAVIMTDSTAPTSPSNCVRSRIEAFAGQGGMQADWYTPGVISYPDMYCRFWWRTNPQFQGRIVANKMFFIRGYGTNGYFGMFGGPNAGSSNFYMAMGINTSGLLDANLYPNVSSGTLTPGVWHMIEAYIKCSTTRSSNNGIIRWWVNGNLVGNYPGMNYCGPGGEGLYNWTWSETWDGAQDMGRSNTVAWEHWIDHLYISTGGTVTPSPSVPTISSFTPTSGPVGTPLTIVGTNFDPSPSGNAVTVNNVACTVLAVVPTQINTAIPNTATTGQVKVVTSAGTALSSTNFTVTTPDPGGGTGGGTGGGAGTTTYTYTTDFSGTQGPRWYYLNENGTQMTYNSGSQLWQGAQAYQGIWNGGFHPGNTSAAVLKYVVPGTGSVHITGNFADLDVGGGNGVICTIKKNGSTTVAGPYAISNGNSTGQSYDVSNSVTDGDYFTFEVGSAGENSFDSTRLNPVVVYTPQSQPTEVITLTLTSISLQEDTAGTITLTITPTRSTDCVITLSSDGASAVVPATATIPANAGSVGVNVVGGTPGTATVTATLGTSSTTSTVTSTAAPAPEEPVPVSPTLSAYTDFLVTYRWF
jgi:hypothetical protein